MIRTPVLLALILLVSTACNRVFYPNAMFQMPKDYPYVDLSEKPIEEYLIHPGDRVSLQVFTNDGYGNVRTVVSSTFEGGGATGSRGLMAYVVHKDSMLHLPVLGSVNLCGMTVQQAELYLVEQYDQYYVDPFVVLEVTNRRVYVFNGAGSNARVVPLTEENMTLVEVLAQAGGIAITGKAYRVKVIRGDLANPEIDLIDLSTMEGMAKGSMVIQADDIIYVDPRMPLVRGFLAEIGPYLGLLSTATTLYLLINNLSR